MSCPQDSKPDEGIKGSRDQGVLGEPVVSIVLSTFETV